MERFPILNKGRHPSWPRSIPWSLIKMHEHQAEKNHGQTLERLSERGGLDPVEMWCVLSDRGWLGIELLDEESAVDMIMRRVSDFKKEAK